MQKVPIMAEADSRMYNFQFDDNIIVSLNSLNSKQLRNKSLCNMQLISNSTFEVIEDGKRVAEGEWDYVAQYTIIDGIIYWTWIHNVEKNDRTKEFHSKLQDKLYEHEFAINNNINSDDPMFASSLISVIVDELEYDYAHIVKTEDKFNFFALKLT